MQLFSSEESEATAYIIESQQSSRVFFFLKDAKFIEIKLRAKAKAMAPHSSTLAWRVPWTEEPGGLQSVGSLGVRHD